jgi:hypothetical protein
MTLYIAGLRRCPCCHQLVEVDHNTIALGHCDTTGHHTCPHSGNPIAGVSL